MSNSETPFLPYPPLPSPSLSLSLVNIMRVAWTLCAPSASPAFTKVAHRCLLAPTTTHDAFQRACGSGEITYPKAVEAADIAERFCAILVRAAKLNAARREKMRDDNMLELAGGNDAPSSPMPPSLPSPHEQLLKAFPLETATPPSQSLTPPSSTLVTSQSPAPELLLDAVGDIEKNALMKPPVSPRVITVDADTEAANKIVDSVMQELLEELV